MLTKQSSSKTFNLISGYNVIETSKKYYQLITLKQLIQKLFKKYSLNENVHFDIWICGYDNKKEHINKDDPWGCYHFNGYKRTKEDGTDIFQWLEFEVEDYEFDISETPEYRLCVKLCDINADFRRW